MQAVRGAAKLKLLSETGIALARSLPNTDPSDTVLHALIAQGQLNRCPGGPGAAPKSKPFS